MADLDLDAGMSLALPELRAQAAAKRLPATHVHAAVVAFLPARGLTVENIAGVAGRLLGRSRETCGRGIHRHPGPVRLRGGHGGGGAPAAPVPCYSNPGAAVAALVRRGALRRVGRAGTRDSLRSPQGCDAEAAHADLELLLADVRGEQLKELDPADAARLLGHYGITVLPSAGFRDSR